MRHLPLALLVALSAPVSAADWRLVSSSEEVDVGRTMGFVDAGTIERAGDRLSMWFELRIERPPGTADGSRGRISAHCRDRWFEVSQASYLLGNRPIKPAPTEARQMAGPGTNMGLVLDNVCARRFLSGPVVPAEFVRRAWNRK